MKSKIKRILLAGLCSVFTFCVSFEILPNNVWAASNVPYIDENGVTQTCASAIELTGSMSDPIVLSEGWYLLPAVSMSVSSRVTVEGNVHAILSDGCDITVNGGISVESGNSLTVYSQSIGENMGKLTATASAGNAGIGGNVGNSNNINGKDGGTVIINGGTINATGGTFADEIVMVNDQGMELEIGLTSGSGAGIGGGGSGANADGLYTTTFGNGGSGGTVIINNGVVYAKGGDGAFGTGFGFSASGIGGGGVYPSPSNTAGAGGTVTINGGTVSAASGGIVQDSGTNTPAYASGIGGGAMSNTGTVTVADMGTLNLPSNYTYWTNTEPSDPGGEGTIYKHSGGTPLVNSSDYKFVKIQTDSASSEKAILKFEIPNQVNSTIDEENHKISVVMPAGTDLTKLTPAIQISAGAAINPESELTQDFTDPVTYTVTAEDGSEQAPLLWNQLKSPILSPKMKQLTTIKITLL